MARVSPRQRLERAQKHLEDLAATYQEFDRQHPYHVVDDLDADTGDYLGRLRIDPGMPAELSLIIGDFVHSTRAALDNMIWLLRDRSVSDPRILKRVAFKVADTSLPDPEHDWQSFQGQAAAWISAGVLDEMYRFQPHVTHRDELTILEALWNGDKHRAPHLAVSQVTLLLTTIEGGTSDDITYEPGPFQEGDVLVRVRAQAEKPQFGPRIECHPCFDGIGPGRGEPIFALLSRLRMYVADEVLPTFETLA
jgi:hypothetical protein